MSCRDRRRGGWSNSSSSSSSSRNKYIIFKTLKWSIYFHICLCANRLKYITSELISSVHPQRRAAHWAGGRSPLPDAVGVEAMDVTAFSGRPSLPGGLCIAFQANGAALSISRRSLIESQHLPRSL